MPEAFLDTNIFIRYFIEDVPRQAKESREIFERIQDNKLKGLISILVVNEIIWILEHYYSLKRFDYIPKLIKLISLKSMRIIDLKKETLMQILDRLEKTSFDFTDLYIFYKAGNKKILSFDRDFKKLK